MSVTNEPESMTTGTGAQDVDAALNEYEASVQPQSKQPNQPEGMEEVLNYIRSQQTNELETELSNVSEFVKGDLSIDLDIARGFIEYQASKDNDLKQAFIQRHTNPMGWKKAQEKLKKQFTNKFPSIDEKATNDTNEMVAAVSGSTNTQESDTSIDYTKLSDEDFQKEIMKIGM